MSKPKLTILIPAKNEGECLAPVIQELPRDLVDEVLVVDGHSTDNTVEVARGAGARVITQEGRGYGMAVATGLKEVSGDFVTFFDADGSYDPAALTPMLAKMSEGYDAVFCSRYLPESGSLDDTWIRALGNWFFTKLMRIFFSVKLSDSLFLYCMVRKDVLSKFEMTSKGFEWCIEFPIRMEHAGLKYCEIPSCERLRIAGDSKVNAANDGTKILWFLIKHKFKTLFDKKAQMSKVNIGI